MTKSLKDLPKFYAKVPKGKWEEVRNELEDAGYGVLDGQENCIANAGTRDLDASDYRYWESDNNIDGIKEISLDEALAILLPEKYGKCKHHVFLEGDSECEVCGTPRGDNQYPLPSDYLTPAKLLDKKEAKKIEKYFIKPTWTTKKEITRSDGIKIEENYIIIDANQSVDKYLRFRKELSFTPEEAKELHDKLRAALARYKKEFNQTK